MKLMKPCFRFVLCLAFLLGAVSRPSVAVAQERGELIEGDEKKAVINAYLDRMKKVRRVRAFGTMDQTGAHLGGNVRRTAFRLFLEDPSYFCYIDHGDEEGEKTPFAESYVMMCDGKWVYSLMPERHQVRSGGRQSMNADLSKMGKDATFEQGVAQLTGGIVQEIGALLFLLKIECRAWDRDEKKGHHFVFEPIVKNFGAYMPFTRVEVWLDEGGAFPRRIKTVQAAADNTFWNWKLWRGKGDLVITREFTDVETNLDGMKEIPAERFRFPVHKNLQIKSTVIP